MILRIECGINVTPIGDIFALSAAPLTRTYRLLAVQTSLHHVHKNACTLGLPAIPEASAYSTLTHTLLSRVEMSDASITTHRR